MSTPTNRNRNVVIASAVVVAALLLAAGVIGMQLASDDDDDEPSPAKVSVDDAVVQVGAGEFVSSDAVLALAVDEDGQLERDDPLSFPPASASELRSFPSLNHHERCPS